MENPQLKQLPAALLPWYGKNKRDLPWRKDRDPYRVWLSEIMLQQTRVEAVKGYYARFLEALPTVEALADCDDDALHKLWEGLGYYSRVRNLKKAARQIVAMGGFPKSHGEILALPGIGDYTAGAICSICYDLPEPAVDGNVLRVISRICNDATPIDLSARKKQVQKDLKAVYPAEAGAFTQALMELGATVCGPNKKPDCQSCPCKDFCLGFREGTAEKLPVKSPRKLRRVEERTVFILSCDGNYALCRRPDSGLLAGLWQFPDMTGKLTAEQALNEVEKMGLKPKEIYRQVEKKHIFTHIEWHMTGVYVEVAEPAGDCLWFAEAEINAQAALPTAYRQFWEERAYV